ncbi:MAG: hypothetical protein ACK45F_05460 [bacterium]
MIPRAGYVLAALLLAACARAPDVAGTWEGTWEAADGTSRGAFRVHVTQRGNRISGRIELSGTWFSEARVDGVVEGLRVRWGVLRGGVAVLTFEGTVGDGRSSGVYRGPAGSGKWAARRVRPP